MALNLSFSFLSCQVELIDDNLFEWHVRLFQIDPESPLAQDMLELQIPNILLHLIFPDNFPFAPPFMRVVEPRIEKGFVMDGGAICMELLTPRGLFCLRNKFSTSSCLYIQTRLKSNFFMHGQAGRLLTPSRLF